MIDLIIVIVVFSFIQSIFGIGLLLFGTPTLLLFGYSYSETLWILLPCSIVISLIQMIDNYDLVRAKKKVAYFTIPTMIISLVFIVSYEHVLDINKVVGFFLIFISIVKFSPKLQIYLQFFIEKQLKLYYVFIGFVHGISNMGGGPLSVLMSTVYIEKIKIRANIAFIYLVLDLSKNNIRVNNIAPGYISTDMTKSSYSDPAMYKDRLDRMMIQRWGQASDIVGAAIFLSSNASSYITGSDIVVDGGWTAKGL